MRLQAKMDDSVPKHPSLLTSSEMANINPVLDHFAETYQERASQ